MNLTFRKRIAFGFGSVLLVALVNGAAGFLSTYRMSGEADQIVINGQKQNLAMEMEWALAGQSEAVRGFLLTGDTRYLESTRQAEQHFLQSADRLAPALVTRRGKELLAAMRILQQRNSADFSRAVELRRSGRTAEAIAVAFSPAMEARRDDMVRDTEELDGLCDQLLTRAVKGHQNAEQQVRLMVVTLCLIGLAGGIILAGLIVHAIARPVLRFAAALKAIASGDLSASDLPVESDDELGQATTSLNLMKNNLRGIVASLAVTAEQVASASNDIAANSGHAAAGADTQKGQAQQIASAMQEMSVTVQEISEGSNRAAQSARQASETARDGGAIVQSALTHMQEIAEAVRQTSGKVTELGNRSDQIGRIIAVIDDIAAQTNLLALNAAIEAARAGEQGRGFAVVAGEVRRLAERTGGATREINSMIEGVQSETRAVVETMQAGTEQVERGVEVTGRAGESLSRIISEAENVGNMVSQIATAATEQAAATQQVTASMTEINRLAFESADQAQHAATSSRRLSALSQELHAMVGRFHLPENPGSSHLQPQQPVGAFASPVVV